MGRRAVSGVVVRFGRALVLAAVALALCPLSASARLSWTGPIGRDTSGNGPSITSIACPSTSECVALDVNGGEVTFNPSSPGPTAATQIDSSEPLSVSCVSVTLCVAVDVGGRVVTFDPNAPASATATTIDSGQVLTGVSCPPSSPTCSAVDGSGNAITFDPSSPATAQTTQVDGAEVLTAVSCPTGNECVAVDGNGSYATFDPTGSTPPHVSGLESSTYLSALTCVSPTSCLAFDGNGTEINFSPQGAGISTTTLDAGHAVTGVACALGPQCTVIDSGGGEVTFVPSASGGGNVFQSQRTTITSATSPAAIACPTTTACVAVDNAGHAITFDASTNGVATISRIDGLPSYTAVACPAATQCTAADGQGYEVTFDPTSPGAVGTQAFVDQNAVTVYSISCPSTAQCTAVDGDGAEVTFNPAAPGSVSPVAIVKNHSLLGIACPSSTQCTAVDDDQYEVTFNPQAPTSGRYAALGTPSQVAITGVSCPSVSQCTAVDAIGDAVTFDPQAPGAPRPTAVLSEPAVAVSCPNLSRCIAIGASGDRATFDPGEPGEATTATVDSSQPEALSCPSATFCVEINSTGHSVEFDPDGAGATVSDSVGTSGSLTGLDCISAGDCVAVDSDGGGFVGRGPIPPAPAGLSAPRISGAAKEGRTLTEAHGRWSQTPTSYVYQWERCVKSGKCRPIAGAVQQSYKLVAADVGHLVRVTELAVDAGGFGAPTLVSAATRKVLKAPQPPGLSRVSLTGIGSGHPRLAVTETAALYGPLLGKLTLSLPHGLGFRLRQAGSRHHRHWLGISIHVGNRALSFSARVKKAVLVVGLAHAESQLKISIGNGALVANKTLQTAVQKRKIKKLTLTASVISGRRTLRAIYRTKVS